MLAHENTYTTIIAAMLVIALLATANGTYV